MLHGTCPNSSQNCRLAQFIKAFPRSCITPKRLLLRSSALKIALTDAGSLSAVSEIGVQVFGLDSLTIEGERGDSCDCDSCK